MIVLEEAVHRGSRVIFIRGNIPGEVLAQMRSRMSLLYSRTNRCFYIESNQGANDILKTLLSAGPVDGRVPVHDPQVPAEYRDALVRMRYSESTRKNYISQFSKFLSHVRVADPTEISETEIQRYLLYLVNERHVSLSTQNIAINSIKFFFEHVLKNPRKRYVIERPRKEFTLPRVLSQDEARRLISQAKNQKHKILLSLLYSSGLRISELLNLRWHDIDFDRRLIVVRAGKGRKDRITLLSDHLSTSLEVYKSTEDGRDYVLEGSAGKPYSATSVNKVVKRMAKKAGILKTVSAHVLRHSFATHLLESGTDIRYIQALLGHENSKTTERYTHVTKKGFEQLRSPLDRLFENSILEDK